MVQRVRVAVDFVQTRSKNAHTLLILELQQHCAQNAPKIRMKALTKSLRQKRKETVRCGSDLDGNFDHEADTKIKLLNKGIASCSAFSLPRFKGFSSIHKKWGGRWIDNNA